MKFAAVGPDKVEVVACESVHISESRIIWLSLDHCGDEPVSRRRTTSDSV